MRKLRRWMEEKGLDYTFFFASRKNFDANVRYFTGFRKDFGTCFLLIEGKERVVITSHDGFKLQKYYDFDRILNLEDYDFDIFKLLKENFEKNVKVAVSKSHFPLNFYEELRKKMKWKFVDGEHFFRRLRAVKLPEEIRVIRKACKLTNLGIELLSEILRNWKMFHDSEVKETLEGFLISIGAEEMAFETLVASGKSSSMIHPPILNKPLTRGLGYVDFGVVYRGYCSDVTLPFCLGNIKNVEKKVVETLFEIYQKLLEEIEKGEKPSVVFQTCKKLMQKKGFKLLHAIGHGLGLDVHDPPSFAAKESIELQDDMVFTLEPAIYTKSFGIRIENDFLMKNGKPVQLTRSNFFQF